MNTLGARLMLPALLVGVVLFVALGFVVGWSGGAIARAYLAAWTFWIGLPAGSMVLLLLLGVTGGRWRAPAYPVLAPAALALPVAALAIVPIFFALPSLYDWAGPGLAAKRPVVEALYLNMPGFVVRAVAILAIWSALAWLAVLFRPSPLVAGLCLIVYGVTASFAATDWLMSIDARFASSAFPADFAMSQIASALALVGVAQAGGPGKAETDIAELLLAAVLGVTYLTFIQGIVIWSDNLPQNARWYTTRLAAGWEPVLAAAFVLGAVIPFLMLIVRRVRESRGATAMASLCVLVGLALHGAWLAAPILGGRTALAAPLAILGMGAFAFALFASASAAAQRRLGIGHV